MGWITDVLEGDNTAFSKVADKLLEIIERTGGFFIGWTWKFNWTGYKKEEQNGKDKDVRV